MIDRYLPEQDSGAESFPLGLFIWVTGVAVWLTWAPFEPGRPSLADLGVGGFCLKWDLELLGHFLLLMPIGLFLSALFHLRKRPRPLLTAWLAATVIALVLEGGQLWIEARGVCTDDFLAGSMGAAVALAVFGRLVGRHPHRPFLNGIGLAVFVGTLIYVSSSTFIGESGLSLRNWDTGYYVVQGDEIGGGRAYRGEVSEAYLCAGLPGDRFCVSPGAGRDSREKLADLALRTQRFEMTAEVVSETDRQRSFSRIVSFSGGVLERNATLAQSGRNLVLRIRTSGDDDPNATNLQFVLEDAVDTAQPTHVRAEFDRGVVRMSAVNGTRNRSGSFRPDLLRGSLSLVGTEWYSRVFRGLGGLAAMGLIFSGTGLFLTRFLKGSLLKAAATSVSVGVLGLFALDSLLLRTVPPGTPEVAFVIAACLAGTILGFLDRRSRLDADASRDVVRRREKHAPARRPTSS